MHNATTKQRLSAFRRKFGIWTTLPRWARARRDRSAAVETVDTAQILTRRVEPERVDTAQVLTATAEPERVDTAQVLTATAEPERVDTAQVLAASAAAARTDPSLADTVALADPAAALPAALPVLQPTPPISDLAAGEPGTAEPSVALRRRRRGLAAGALAGLVLVLLAFLALVPWLRGPAPETAPEPVAAISVPSAAAAPSPRPSPPLRGGEGESGTAAPAAAPASALAAGVIEVRSGDTLWDLAAAHLGDPFKWPLLHQANRAIVENPDLIHPGQALRIPSG